MEEKSDLTNGGNGNGAKFNANIEATAAYANILNEIKDFGRKQNEQTITLNEVKTSVDALSANPMIKFGIAIQKTPATIKVGIGTLAPLATLIYTLHLLKIL